MKTAFSCAGEGFGHVSRMVSFAQGLKNKHDMIFFAPISVQPHIRENLPDVEIITIPYFHLAKNEDRISYVRTARENLSKGLSFRSDVRWIRRKLQALQVQAVVSDYEPYLPAAARALDLPVLQVNHPGVVIQYPSLSPDAVTARIIARLMMGRADRYMFVSFYNGDVGPILRDQFFEQQRAREDFYVVYLKPSYRRKVVSELAALGVRNYELFPDPNKDFAASLARCKAVITSAGHQTLSEAVTLGKPVFAIPQRGQFEQRLNARMLVESGWGMKGRFSNLSSSLGAFIRNVDAFPLYSDKEEYSSTSGTRFRFCNDRDKAVNMIDSFIREYTGKNGIQRFVLNFQHGLQATLEQLGMAG